jgi:hypothetical protein
MTLTLPELSDLLRFSSWDGTVWACFLWYCARTVKWFADYEHKAGRLKNFGFFGLISLAIRFFALVLLTAGLFWMPQRGLGAWGVMGLFSLLSAVINVERYKRTGTMPI